jgi:uncharacterized protein (TIGR02265 family)
MEAPASVEVAPKHVALGDRAVFAQAFESLLRTCGTPPSAEVVLAFKKAGVDVDRPLQVAYPLPVYLDVVLAVRQLRYPQLSDAEAFHRLGRSFIERYSTTVMGKALMAMLKLMGPKRALSRLTQSFRTASNYVEATAREIGPGRHEVRIWPVRYADYYQGMLQAGLEAAGAKDLVVTTRSYEDEVAVYELRW